VRPSALAARQGAIGPSDVVAGVPSSLARSGGVLVAAGAAAAPGLAGGAGAGAVPPGGRARRAIGGWDGRMAAGGPWRVLGRSGEGGSGPGGGWGLFFRTKELSF
jgi:hypothetical protein